uniref:Ubiquinone biosynthesis protein n=1 Tax=Rodentolepis nana TaxID=102285 RepID=A0A158QJ54_RODNA
LSIILKERNLNALHDIIESHCSPDSQNILDILSWLLRQLADSSAEHPPGFGDFAKSHIQSLSQYVTSKEFLVITLGELEGRGSMHLLSFSMSFIESCALSIGLSSTADIQSLFNVIRRNMHQILLNTHSSRFFKCGGVFTTFLKDFGKMLVSLFSQDLDNICLETYADDVLYYFAEPLQFLDFNADNIPIFESFLSVLGIVIPSLYSACYKPYHLSYISTDTYSHPFEFADNYTALLFVWNLCLSNKALHSFLPCVFTKLYKYEVLVYMCIPLVEKLTNKLAQDNSLSPIETKQLIRVQKGLMSNSSDLKECFPSLWWRQRVVFLIKNLESFCKHPIMGIKIPSEIVNCISTIESLLSTATITARCQLYAEIFDQSSKPFHSGFRSHMIVNFKNFLHSNLISWKEDKVSKEEKLGETCVVLPYYPVYLRQIFDLIFIYPLPDCNEIFIHHFGWLNAALNFAFYIISRYNGVNNGNFDEQLRIIMHDVVLALSRPSDNGRSTLETKFLEPLYEAIITTSNKYKRAVSEYESNPDPSMIAPNAPSLSKMIVSGFQRWVHKKLILLILFVNDCGNLTNFLFRCLTYAFTLSRTHRRVISVTQRRLLSSSSISFSVFAPARMIRNPINRMAFSTSGSSTVDGSTSIPYSSHNRAESDSDSDCNSSFREDEAALEQMCERAMEAAIPHVRTLGWSRSALEAACIDLNLPPGLHTVALPRGPIDLVLYFYESRNHRLADVLAKWRKEEPGADGQLYKVAKPNSFGFEAPPPFKTQQETDAFLHRAIEYRLRANDEVQPQWRQAMGILSLPQNIPAAIGLEAQLVDEIWAQAGDRSVDVSQKSVISAYISLEIMLITCCRIMNWYAKRLGLAYVYKLTELFYIQDTSADHKETWKFLDRRISDLRSMKKAKVSLPSTNVGISEL